MGNESKPITLGDAGNKIICFYKGGTDAVGSATSSSVKDPAALVRKDLADVLNSRQLSFLIGSGCSSAWRDGDGEVGIPTMAPMAKEFTGLTVGPFAVSVADRDLLSHTLGLDLSDDLYKSNLEGLMEVLYGFQFALERSHNADLKQALPAVARTILNVKKFVLEKCLHGKFADGDNTVLDVYEQFYRRLTQRDRALPRPWVFTTNYDLFSETAMDHLGIPYINGFSGSVDRRFNPATFRYALAEQLDISSRKWSSVDSLVYFAKLHGSISWETQESGLFPVAEKHPRLIDDDQLLIYPTPAKQGASFASPYSDMFRELQTRVAREQSALVTLGYSFGDEHVNNIIFQALTIPTFRLVAFIDPDANHVVRTLRNLNDPRIWIVGSPRSSSYKAHYFSNFVHDLMVSEGDDPADAAISQVLKMFGGRGGSRVADDE